MVTTGVKWWSMTPVSSHLELEASTQLLFPLITAADLLHNLTLHTMKCQGYVLTRPNVQ